MKNPIRLILGVIALVLLSYVLIVALNHIDREYIEGYESGDGALSMHNFQTKYFSNKELEAEGVEEQIDTYSKIDSECRKATESWSYEDPLPECIFVALKQLSKDGDKDIKLKVFDTLCTAEYKARNQNDLVPGSCQVDYWNKKRLGTLKGEQKLPELKTDKN